jgi:DNA-directed RNA polymerase I, II, and III subunit RPABC1
MKVNVCKNVNSMLVARGFVSSDELCNEHVDWDERFVHLLDGVCLLTVDLVCRRVVLVHGKKDLLVLFSLDAKAGKALVNWVLEQVRERECDHAIFVVAAELTSGARKELLASAKTIRVEVFSVLEVSFNLLEHKLVPRHRPLSKDEASGVLEKYQTELSLIPRIKQSDPVCKWLDVPKETMLEITRNPGTLEEVVTYRVVV